ncbi:MAG: MerR family DNA-binding transcriptional regulator [Thermoleophilia bacterium]
MRTLKTSEAASLLNVSPNTLRAWERRFGYPKPQRSAGRHRLYTYGEVTALRDALQQGLSISSAVSRAREALSTDTHTLVGALAGFELDRADGAMESALALRSLERSVEEVLLPSLAELGKRYGIDSAPWAFAARWGDGWLRRAQRLAPPPARRLAILVGDATRNELDPDALAVRAFELFCGRSGSRVMALPVGGVSGLSDVVESLAPDAVVIAGGHLPDDDVALWAYRVRAAAGPLPMALFRRSQHGAKVRTTGTRILPDTPFAAQRALLALIDDRPAPHVHDVAALSVLDGDGPRREAQA